MKKLLKFLSYVLVAAMASAATLGIVAMEGHFETSKLDQLQGLIEERFVGEVDPTAMGDAAAAAMVYALGDQWSHYIPAADYQDYLDTMNNSYVGVGITIQVAEDGTGFLVLKVEPTGPAAEAGLQAGDIIVGISGQSAAGMTTSEAGDLVKGEAGTTVDMTIRRDGAELPFTIERRQVLTVVAEGEMLEDGIGLVTIHNFDARCYEETIAAIEDVLAQGAEKLIFDVRNNPGGYKSELVKVLDYLLPEGDLFRSEYYDGTEYTDTSDADCLEIPMAVLMNGESYSAAEFFAAALAEYDAAFTVGQQTCGKGYFQTTLELNDGSAVGLSVGKYYTPNGVCLADVGGLTPDIVVEVDDETFASIYAGILEPEDDPQIQAAIEVLKAE